MSNKNQFANLGKVTKGATKTTGVSPFSNILIALIYPNPHQPRKKFANIEELATSIESNGLISPITVVKRGKRYMIVAGERRYRAMQSLGKKLIKCHIVEKTDAEIEEIALVENIARDDLNVIEIVMSVNKMLESGRYQTQGELAKKIGKTGSYITKCKNIMTLPIEILNNVGDRGFEVLSELTRIDNDEDKIYLWDEKATVKDIRKTIDEKKEDEERNRIAKETQKTKEYLWELEGKDVEKMNQLAEDKKRKEVSSAKMCQEVQDDNEHLTQKEITFIYNPKILKFSRKVKEFCGESNIDIDFIEGKQYKITIEEMI